MMSSFFSIIIPTRNRSAYLVDAVESIYKNNFSTNLFEVLIVDNGSTDDTNKICSHLKQQHPNLKYFLEIRNGLHYGRHKGLEESKGDILIFIDDDVLVSEKWLESFQKVFLLDQKIVLAGGNNLPKFEGDQPLWVKSLWKNCVSGRYLSEYSLIDFKIPEQEISPYFIYGCNFAIRKQFLLTCKGFHPDGFSKENILYRGDGETYISENIQSLGLKAYFHPEATLYHRTPQERLTKDYLYSRHLAQGISYSYANLRRKKKLSMIDYFLLRLEYRIRKLRALFIRTEMFRKMNLAFYEGAISHLNAYYNQDKIQKWVQKDHYMDVEK